MATVPSGPHPQIEMPLENKEVDDIDDVLNDIFNENKDNKQVSKVVEKSKKESKPSQPVVEANFDDTEESDEFDPNDFDPGALEDPLEEVFGPKEEKEDEPEESPRKRKADKGKPKPAPAPQPPRRRRRSKPPERTKQQRSAAPSEPKDKPEESSAQKPSAPKDSGGSWEQYFKPVKKELKQVILIDGSEGTGKTHWAVTQTPGPHYLIDTEGEHNLHTANEVCDDLFAFVIRADPTKRPAKVWFGGANNMWDQVEKAGVALRDAPPGTVILDSGTDLLPIVVSQLNIDWDRGNDAFPPMLYGQVYGVLGSYISYIRRYHNVVITAKLKEQWKGNSSTGKMERSIWNNAEHLCEHLVSIAWEGDQKIYYFQRKKRRDAMVPLEELTWDHIVNGVPEEERQKALYKDQVKRLQKGIAMLKSKGVEFDEEIPRTLKGVKDKIKEATEKFQEVKEKEKQAKRSRRRKPQKKE